MWLILQGAVDALALPGVKYKKNIYPNPCDRHRFPVTHIESTSFHKHYLIQVFEHRLLEQHVVCIELYIYIYICVCMYVWYIYILISAWYFLWGPARWDVWTWAWACLHGRGIEWETVAEDYNIHCGMTMLSTLPSSWMEPPYQYDCFAPLLVETYVSSNRSPLTIYNRPFVSFMFGFCSVTFSLFLVSTDSPTASRTKQCVAFVLITFSCELSLCAQCHLKQIGNYANQYPVCSYWIYCSFLGSWAFSEGDLENYWSVTRCHLKRFMPCSWKEQSYSGATWAPTEDDHIKRKPRPSPYHEREQVSPNVRDQGGADRRIGRSVSGRMVPGRI